MNIHKVPLTCKMLVERALKVDQAEDWIDWAIEMLLAGFDTEHLRILAGLLPPFNRFELNVFVDKTLQELKLDNQHEDDLTYGYVYYLILQALDKQKSFKSVLSEIRSLCIYRGHDQNLMPFYLLYYALDDLETDTVQWYWNGANRENISDIIKGELLQWKKSYEILSEEH